MFLIAIKVSCQLRVLDRVMIDPAAANDVNLIPHDFFSVCHFRVTFGQKLKITFRFRTSVWAPKNLLMHIVSNCCYKCDHISKPSIDIAVIPSDNGGVAVFRASTVEAGENFVFVHYEDTVSIRISFRLVISKNTCRGRKLKVCSSDGKHHVKRRKILVTSNFLTSSW